MLDLILVTWCHECGIPVLDDQHRAIAQRINRLHQDFLLGKSASVLFDQLVELKDAIKVHHEIEKRKLCKPDLEAGGLQLVVNEMVGTLERDQESIYDRKYIDMLRNFFMAHLAEINFMSREMAGATVAHRQPL